MASCRQVESLVQAYLDGELRDSERIILEQHLHACPACAQLLQRQQANAAMLFEVLADYRLKDDLAPVVMAHLPEMEAVAVTSGTLRRVGQPERLSTRIAALVPAFVPAVLVLVAIALWIFWPVGPAPAHPVGLVTQILGEATRMHEAMPRRKEVELASPVVQGEWLQTGADSGLVVALAGESELKIGENSRVRVLSDRRVAVEAGQVLLDVGADARLFRVETPAGDVNVLGTIFNVEINGNGSRALVTVAEGEVQVQNDVTFALVRPGEQVELALARKPLRITRVDVEAVLAWALRLQPNPQVQANQNARTYISAPRVMRAEQVFVVTPEKGDMAGIHAIVLGWTPALDADDHCSYEIFISDERMNPLLVHRVEAGVFQSKDRNTYLLDLTAHPEVRNARLLHIKLVPDTSTGGVETSFEVEALGE